MDNEPALAGQVIDEDVILDAPRLVAVEGVVGFAHWQCGHVEGRHRTQQLGCLRPPHPRPREVRDVEDADTLAHGLVLADDAPVLERHLPAREGGEAGAQRLVALMQRELSETASTAGAALFRHRLTASSAFSRAPIAYGVSTCIEPIDATAPPTSNQVGGKGVQKRCEPLRPGGGRFPATRHVATGSKTLSAPLDPPRAPASLRLREGAPGPSRTG